MAVAEHDTQSAIAAIPSDIEGHAYISCGTWSIMVVRGEESYRHQGSHVGWVFR